MAWGWALPRCHVRLWNRGHDASHVVGAPVRPSRAFGWVSGVACLSVLVSSVPCTHTAPWPSPGTAPCTPPARPPPARPRQATDVLSAEGPQALRTPGSGGDTATDVSRVGRSQLRCSARHRGAGSCASAACAPRCGPTVRTPGHVLSQPCPWSVWPRASPCYCGWQALHAPDGGLGQSSRGHGPVTLPSEAWRGLGPGALDSPHEKPPRGVPRAPPPPGSGGVSVTGVCRASCLPCPRVTCVRWAPFPARHLSFVFLGDGLEQRKGFAESDLPVFLLRPGLGLPSIRTPPAPPSGPRAGGVMVGTVQALTRPELAFVCAAEKTFPFECLRHRCREQTPHGEFRSSALQPVCLSAVHTCATRGHLNYCRFGISAEGRLGLSGSFEFSHQF